ARDREEVAARVDQVDLPHRTASVDAAVLGTSTNQSWLRAIRVPIRSRIKVRVTMIAENIETSTPTASVRAKPCTRGASNEPRMGTSIPPPRTYRIRQVMSVVAFESRIEGQARANPASRAAA